MRTDKKSGFSLVEVTVTISIFAVLTSMSMLSFNDIRNNISLKNDVNELANSLAYAQNQAINSFAGLKHGIYFQTDRYTIFSGDSYALAASKNEIYFRNGVKLFSPAGTEVIFNRLTGASHDQTIIIGTSPENQLAIKINSIGKISSDQHE